MTAGSRTIRGTFGGHTLRIVSRYGVTFLERGAIACLSLVERDL